MLYHDDIFKNRTPFNTTPDFANDGVDSHSSRIFAKIKLQSSLSPIHCQNCVTPRWATIEEDLPESVQQIISHWLNEHEPSEIRHYLEENLSDLIKQKSICAINILRYKQHIYDPQDLDRRINLLIDVRRSNIESAWDLYY